MCAIIQLSGLVLECPTLSETEYFGLMWTWDISEIECTAAVNGCFVVWRMLLILGTVQLRDATLCDTIYYLVSFAVFGVGHTADAGTKSASAAMWLWTNSWVCLDCLWVIFGNNILFVGAYVLAAEDADGAAQGERWCMRQIVAPAAFLAAEADHFDGFRLKPPQIPYCPTREQPPMSV